MIFQMPYLRTIKGILKYDPGKHPAKTGGPDLKGVTVSLLSVNKVSAASTADTVRAYREILLATAKTNEKGEFKFKTSRGSYAVILDVKTLPEGFGVPTERYLIEDSGDKELIYTLKPVTGIGSFHEPGKQLSWGSPFSIHPVIKAEDGSILAAPFRVEHDSGRSDEDGSRYSPSHSAFAQSEANIKICCGDITRQCTVHYEIPPVDSVSRIRLAHEHGLIGEKEKIECYMNYLFNRQQLQRGYHSNIPVKSGSTMIKELADYISTPDSDAELADKVRSRLSTSIPDLDKYYTSPMGNFRIHYTLIGSNAVSREDANRNGIPDYIENIGAAFEDVRQITCIQRGFRLPLPDSGKSYMDIYVYDLKGIYGITFPSSNSSKNPQGRKVSSYIAVDSSYAESKGFKKTRDACMRVTAAHEYFHAVQNAYNADADTWWKEASATWNEDEIYTGVDDYVQYIGKLFSAPDKPLEKSSYGGVIFAKYLSENLGGFGIIKRIWEVQAAEHRSSVNAIDKAVGEYSSSLNIGEVYNRYTACNYNPSQYYREGGLWTFPIAVKDEYTTYPVARHSSTLNHLSADYILFKPAASAAGTLKIVIESQDEQRFRFKVQKKRAADNICELSELSVSGSANRSEILMDGFGSTYKEVCLIPANIQKAADNISYRYSSELQQA